MTSSPGGLAVGLDLGGTKVLGVVVDAAAAGGPLIEEKVATPRGAEAVVDTLADLGAQLRDRAAGELGRPATALGVGAPGLVDRGGTLHLAPNLPGVVDIGFAAVLEERLGLPVAVENDATCAAWGEHERGASRGHDHSLLITLGTGIGAGITVKGEVLRGANGFAGEPGHMVIDPDGLMCPCGRRGCWERYASGSGLGQLAREAAHAGRADAALALAGGDPEDVRGEHLTTAAAGGDGQAKEVLARFGWWVALGIANLVNLLDSDIVVIGGGLVSAGDLILEPTRTSYRELVLGADHRPTVPIVPALLGGHAGAIGAALLATARS